MKYFKVILNSDRVPLMTLSSVIIVIASCLRCFHVSMLSCEKLLHLHHYVLLSRVHALFLRLSCHETFTFLSPNCPLPNSLIIRRIFISLVFVKYPYTSLRHRRTCPLLYPAHGMLQGGFHYYNVVLIPFLE